MEANVKKIASVMFLVVVAMLSVTVSQALETRSLDLYKIGKNWGSRGQWQFGIDKGLTAGGCIQRELNDGQWLAGPCRDVFVLARRDPVTNDVDNMIHLGPYIMYNAERGNPSYGARLGFTAGNVARAMLDKAAENIPVLEFYAGWKAPPFLHYLRKILTLDYGIAWRPDHSADVIGNWTHGPMFKLDIPIDDIYGLLTKGL